MAFVNPSLGRSSPFIPKGNYALNRSTGSSHFIDTFNGIVRPFGPASFRPGVNVNFNLNMGKGKGSDDGGGKFSDSSSNNGNTGNGENRNHGRSHLSKRGFTVPESRGVSSLTFTTDISPGFVINGYESSINGYSTCFLQCGSFFDTITENMFQTQLDDVLFSEYLFEIQKRVRYNIDKKLTKFNFYRYFSNVSNALQLFYMVDSIIAHSQSTNIRHKNRGLQYLRSTFDADLLSCHQRLNEVLTTVPVPPNLLNFIRYLMQNFTFTEGEGYPIYRLAFRQTLHNSCKSGSLSPQYYDVIINELISDTTTIGILNAAFPKEFKFDDLPPSQDVPIYDKNFITFWSNNDITYLVDKAKELSHTRYVADESQNYKYFVFNSDVDGIFYGSSTIYNVNSQRSETGIWSPIRDFVQMTTTNSRQRSSLLCYYDDISRFEAPNNLSLSVQSGVYHALYYTTLDKGYQYHDRAGIPIGCVKVQSNCLFDLRQPVAESAKFIFNYTNS
jgi:hypothetical protein